MTYSNIVLKTISPNNITVHVIDIFLLKIGILGVLEAIEHHRS